MLGGIPTAGLLLLLILAVVFMYVFGWIWFIVPIVLLYFVMRFLTARDEWMIDMVIENIGQKDIYIP
jgi:type IV secretory pathway VirB3-like protein